MYYPSLVQSIPDFESRQATTAALGRTREILEILCSADPNKKARHWRRYLAFTTMEYATTYDERCMKTIICSSLSSRMGGLS